jgi:hypothetical protein
MVSLSPEVFIPSKTEVAGRNRFCKGRNVPGTINNVNSLAIFSYKGSLLTWTQVWLHQLSPRSN